MYAIVRINLNLLWILICVSESITYARLVILLFCFQAIIKTYRYVQMIIKRMTMHIAFLYSNVPAFNTWRGRQTLPGYQLNQLEFSENVTSLIMTYSHNVQMITLTRWGVSSALYLRGQRMEIKQSNPIIKMWSKDRPIGTLQKNSLTRQIVWVPSSSGSLNNSTKCDAIFKGSPNRPAKRSAIAKLDMRWLVWDDRIVEDLKNATNTIAFPLIVKKKKIKSIKRCKLASHTGKCKTELWFPFWLGRLEDVKFNVTSLVFQLLDAIFWNLKFWQFSVRYFRITFVSKWSTAFHKLLRDKLLRYPHTSSMFNELPHLQKVNSGGDGEVLNISVRNATCFASNNIHLYDQPKYLCSSAEKAVFKSWAPGGDSLSSQKYHDQSVLYIYIKITYGHLSRLKLHKIFQSKGDSFSVDFSKMYSLFYSKCLLIRWNWNLQVIFLNIFSAQFSTLNWFLNRLLASFPWAIRYRLRWT